MTYDDPKRIVREGYDRIVQQHAEWAGQVRREERERYTYLLQQRVPRDSRVLELGCGTGVPTTRELAEDLPSSGSTFRPGNWLWRG